ncbi:MAG: FAD:protein FMN transferase [Candidatus Krumholzibacteria bacterium]|nr:FAD:protein FMN transferase [Candidatus Krumholzibacteria bacterium]
MSKKDVLSKLNRSVDRRSFLKACGVLGVGAVAGGILQSKYDVVGLGRGLKKVSQTRIAMGTYVTVTAVHTSRDLAEDAIGRAFDEMDRLIAVFNRHDSATPVSVLNRDGSVSGPPPELKDVLGWARQFNGVTAGRFDVTVKPLVDLFSETVSRNALTLPRDDQIAAALGRVDAGGVDITAKEIRFKNDGMGVTLDGIAKGYIVDMMSAALAERGVTDHLVNAGGDIRTSGANASGKPWTVAVEDPKKKRSYPAVIRMTDGAVATSGSYEIYYDREKVFHHVVDPQSGVSPQHSVSATVRARSVMVADALSTGVFVAEPQEGVMLVESIHPTYDTTCLILGADGERYACGAWVATQA